MTIETLCERLVFRSIDKALNRGEVLAQRLGERSCISLAMGRRGKNHRKTSAAAAVATEPSLSLIKSSPVTLKEEGRKEGRKSFEQ
jgi:hypothetical protein